MKSINKLKILSGFLFALLALVVWSQGTEANVTTNSPTSINVYQSYTFFATSTNQTTFATTTSATSTNILAWVDSNGRVDIGSANLAGAKKATFEFKRADDLSSNTGKSTFRVQVSPDGSNWYYWGKWVENASSTLGFTNKTYAVTAFDVTGTTTVTVSMDLTNDTFSSARCLVQEATDGAHSCKVNISY